MFFSSGFTAYRLLPRAVRFLIGFQGLMYISAFPVVAKSGKGSLNEIRMLTLPATASTPPVAVSDAASTCQGVVISINILQNDLNQNPGGSIDPTSVDLGPGNGKTVTVPGGVFTADPTTGLVQFSPAVNFQGLAQTQYTINDNFGNLSNQATIQVAVLTNPKLFTITGGGNYCQGSFAGVGVGLNNSELGVQYQLVINGVNSGSAIPGTSSPISFGNQTTVGIYRVVGTRTSNLCSQTMNSSVKVNSVPPPNVYTVSGGGIGCSGGPGAIVTLSGSNLGVNYQLQNGATLVGLPVAGTGAALSFPPVTGASGNYMVGATDATTGCTATMSQSALVTIVPSPKLFTVSGIFLCEGDPRATIRLSGSEVGIDYQVLLGGAPVGSTVPGTGAALSFTGFTSIGSYNILALSPTGCISTMRNSATILALPFVYTLSPSIQHYCLGGLGVNITLSGSQTGVNYQLLKNGINSGVPLPGTSTSLSFGPLDQGSYTVIATNASGCSSPSTNTAQVIADNPPTAYTLNPINAHFCIGSAGVRLILTGSQVGVIYRLIKNGTALAPGVSGTGNPLDFGFYPQGTYQVTADPGTICPLVASNTTLIIQDSLPKEFILSPAAARFCIDQPGISLSLSGSETSIQYQLRRAGVALGPPVSGTGAGLSFGVFTSGTYTVQALNPATGCTLNFSSQAVLTADSLPTSFTLLAPKTRYCAGDSGINITLSGSQLGVNYQLYSSGVAAGPPQSGTGSALGFSVQPAGIYTVTAKNTTSGCTRNFPDTIRITQDPLPLVFRLTPSLSHYCKGSLGSRLTLSGSESGIQYQLYQSLFATGKVVIGTGKALDFGSQTEGNYSVMATNPLTRCRSVTAGAIIVADSTPKAYTLLPKNPHYCQNSSLYLALSGSEKGVNYSLDSSGIAIGQAIAGTGKVIFVGPLTKGIYRISAALPGSTCPAVYTAPDTVTEDPRPLNFTVSGSLTYCPNATGTTLSLSGSETGIVYQLKNLSGNVGAAKAGSTGSSLTFFPVPSGIYTIEATSGDGCTAVMNTGKAFTVGAPLQASIVTRKAICFSLNSGLASVSVRGGTAPYRFLWKSGQTDSIVRNLTPGAYPVTITDQSGCSLTLIGTINASKPPAAQTVQLLTLYNTPVQIPLASIALPGDTLINPFSLDLDTLAPGIQPTFTVAGKGRFSVDSVGSITFVPYNLFVGDVKIPFKLADRNGCSSGVGYLMITVRANLDATRPFKIPTLFTPNGDGINDQFEIEGLQLFPENTLAIFNRWGNQVFFGKSYMSSGSLWDGSGLGEGTYFYMLEVNINGTRKTMSGYTVLVRNSK